MKKITLSVFLSAFTLFTQAKDLTLINKQEISLLNKSELNFLNVKESSLVKSESSNTKKTTESNGEGTGEQKIAVKINLTKLLQKVIYVQGEYAFHEKLSVAVGISGVSRGLPNFITNRDSTGASKLMRFSGFSFTPELRFYPGSKKEAPRGFYLAPYFKVASYKVTMPMDFNLSGRDYSYELSGKYTGIGGGLMLGSQWISEGGFTFDWWIVGAHYRVAKASLAVDGDFGMFSEVDKDEIADGIEAQLEASPIGTANSKVTNTRIEGSLSGLPFSGIRGFGFCFGYAF